MARLARRYSSSDDELPELDALLRKTTTKATRNSQPATKAAVKPLVPRATTASSTRRVRRLAEPDQVLGNPLFQKWDVSKDGEVSKPRLKAKLDEPQVTVKEVKKRVAKPNVAKKSVFEDDEHATQKETSRTQRNRPRVVDELREDSDGESESEDENLLARLQRLKTARSNTTVPRLRGERPAFPEPETKKESSSRQRTPVYDIDSESDGARENAGGEDDSFYRTAEEEESFSENEDAASDFGSDTQDLPRKILPSKLLFHRPQLNPKGSTLPAKTAPKSTASELAETFSKLRLQLDEFSEDEVPKQDRFTTPPSTPPRPIKPKGLISPTKKLTIPKTPHRPSTDAIWSQDIVNDWNEQHSPRKLILSPVKKSAVKTSPKKETKKAFAARKHAIAEDFLRELDQEITQGRIAELAESTGGVKIVWSKTLNTTAGRANWRRETLRTKKADGTQVSVTYKHHASIELAEKVIDDEDRLLNVLAHEFCHLANFMITGMTTNPHGKEFKVWASRVSHGFSSRAINVTTKHTYEIDFKYVWTCSACAAEYKRHSKSIDPQRHRCGTCKSELKQTKPVPRGGGKVTKYQAFVKEQMAVVREENPGSPQKDVMRLIGEKWAREGGAKKGGVDAVVGKMIDLTLDE